MKNLLVTGGTGLVGSRFVADFSADYHLHLLTTRDPHFPTDICDFDQVLARFEQAQPTTVIHLAAYTDVTGAWKQRGSLEGTAYQINVVGTKNIIAACERYNAHLIFVSTAYVFDGEKSDRYVETDAVRPIEWYGETKAKAEELVREMESLWTIFRIDQPFRSDPFPKLDSVHRIIAGLKNKSLYPSFTDHFFGPTFIDDFAKVLDWAARSQSTGLYHASSGEKWSDFAFAQAVNEIVAVGGVVNPGKLDEYLITLNRPYQRNTSLNTEKLAGALDFSQHSVREALGLVQKD